MARYMKYIICNVADCNGKGHVPNCDDSDTNLWLCEIKGSQSVTLVLGDVSPLEINQHIR